MGRMKISSTKHLQASSTPLFSSSSSSSLLPLFLSPSLSSFSSPFLFSRSSFTLSSATKNRTPFILPRLLSSQLPSSLLSSFSSSSSFVLLRNLTYQRRSSSFIARSTSSSSLFFPSSSSFSPVAPTSQPLKNNSVKSFSSSSSSPSSPLSSRVAISLERRCPTQNFSCLCSYLSSSKTFYHEDTHERIRSHGGPLGSRDFPSRATSLRGKRVKRDLSTATAPLEEEEEEILSASRCSSSSPPLPSEASREKETENGREGCDKISGNFPPPREEDEEERKELSASADVEYQRAADALLKNLFIQVEQSNLEGLDDIDYQEGVLKITCEGGETIVLNKHYASKQIWYASPISGGDYFEYSAESSSGDAKTWKSLRSGRSLEEALLRELKQISSHTPHS
ncbi:iron donor protein [Cystoisospora suis]|uniref:Iron donor protein n=1 Tax=Cystoisospora suis TaxID=483139 RepID=A0A2C6KK99_9APIC|nr:iron donor protein [Cystoisospora suis]